jgi:hypothetical protein
LLCQYYFNGRFKFQLAYFNNRPDNDARENDSYDLQLGNKELKVKFNEKSKDLSREEVHQRLLCDPTKYFEFEFSNVIVSRITYDDGSNTDRKDVNESIVGKLIFLKGMLVDLAPHLQRGQLYAGDIRITDTLIGRLNKAIQSSVYGNIRIIGNEERKNRLFHYSAYFETDLYDVFKLVDPYLSEQNSRFIKELKDLNLKIYFNLNRYDIATNEGEVFGYISSYLPLTNAEGILIRNRSLIFNNSILNNKNSLYRDIINDFQLDPLNDGKFPRATFEIEENTSLLILRYMDIIPFIDYNYKTLNYQYYVILRTNKKDGSSSYEKIMIDESYDEMKKSGGIKVLKLSDKEQFDINHLDVMVMAGKSESSLVDLLIEPKWKLILDEDELIKMNSNEIKKITGKVFNQSKLPLDKQILRLESIDDEQSPLVARFEKEETEVKDGIFEANIVSHNLENSDKIMDPVTQGELQGDLPWDRYYGNYLSITLKDSEIQDAVLIFPVRVIHKINDDQISSFKDIAKLFSYYLRYYPWIHVRIEDCNYNQFLDFNNLNRLGRFKDTILTRLGLEDSDWFKMPRSRDFPKNGEKVIKYIFENPPTDE